MSSDRVCQFFLRGHCKREDCEFKHEKPESSSAGGDETASGPVPVCHLFLTGSCKADTCKFRHEKPDKSASSEASKEAAEAAKDDTEVSKKSDAKAKETAPDVTTNDTSTFIAATSDETIGGADPVLARRAATTANNDKEVAAPAAKEVRRDSKGFEDFDDYFDSDANDTTVNTVTDKSAAEEEPMETEATEEASETVPEEDLDGKKNADQQKDKKLQDLSKQWDEEEPPKTTEEAAAEAPEDPEPEAETENPPAAASAGQSNEETIENIENFIEDTNKDQPAAAASNEASKEANKKGGKEEWVTVIFGEDGKEITPAEAKKEKSVYDMEDEDFSATKATPFPGRKKSLAKTEGVTRIGNNTYYYSGDKEEAAAAAAASGADTEEEELEDRPEDAGLITADHYDEFDESNDMSEMGSIQGDPGTPGGEGESPGKRKAGRGYAQGRRKHNTNYVYGAKSTAAKTRRCGECEGCNREDCGKCPSCVDKPKFGGKGLKKQACIYRICTWKNPSGKRITPQTPTLASSKKGVPTGTIVSPAAVRRVTDGPNVTSTPATASNDADYDEAETPKSAGKKGGRNTRGRKSISVVSPAVNSEEGETVKKGDDEYIVIASGNTGLTGKYWQDMDKLPSRRRCTITPPPGPPAAKPGEKRKAAAGQSEESPAVKKGRKTKENDQAEQQERSPKGRGAAGGAKRKAAAASSSEDEQEGTPTKTNGTTTATPAQRNISCLSDSNATGSQQREVVVECFAPYDDHRWVNIGKEKNGAAPDAVQYARALRPPYQLLSFLRIKGNCSKGLGCSNKNTMVFVVLEGEITVEIHNTQFVAKKGDSFYIPPKNYYNLINNKARTAELSLLQYQYSGPLPSVPAGSQSGQTPNGVQN